MGPLVGISIVIPARNAGKTIGETLESVRAQSYPGWEVIVVVDDGSEDDTAGIAEGHASADDRIRVVTGRGEGASAARNQGIEQAQFDHLLFLDSDDLISPRHLEQLEGRLQTEPTAAGACST
jgi:glycosyltransferase involved in cell wall biosynthesis